MQIFQKDSPPQTYWSVVVEPGWIQAGIWQVINGSASILSVSPPTPWETEDELIGSADAALSSCVQKLDNDTPEPQKTVFGVPASWVEKGEIKEKYLADIKKICTELSLTPVGFVVLSEAIANYYKSGEGAGINAIVVGVSSESLEVSVFKKGNLMGNTQVSRSVSASEDVIEGLSRFGLDEPLPSRIIVFDGKEGEIEDFRQVLIDASWDGVEKIKFLHTPKVEIFESEKKVLATALAGGSEIANVTQIVLEKEEDEVKPLDSEKLGFVVGEDITQNKPDTEPKKVEPEEMRENIITKSKLPKFKFKLPAINLPAFPFSLKEGGKTSLLAGLFFLVALLVSGVIFWWFYPTAKVVIYVAPKKFEETFTIDSTSLGQEQVSVDMSGDRTTPTTGTKTVGDKAKGIVTLYRVGPSVMLPAGTVLLGPGNLAFSLDEDVKVASGSATSIGNTSAKVTAKNIGAEYNLASATTFSVGNYGADLEAKNDAAFSGGTSHEIQAVDRRDQENLLNDLQQELVSKAKNKIISDLAADRFLVESSATTEATDKNFDHKVGDEADNLKLNLSLKVSFVTLDKQKLIDFAKESLKDKVPSNYVLRDDQLSFSFNSDSKLVISANLLPQINTDEIKQKIAGKLPGVVEEYLTSVAGFSRAEINISPHLSGRFGTLPKVAKHIQIEISAER